MRKSLLLISALLPLSLSSAVGDHFYYDVWYYEILSETELTVANLGATSTSSSLLYPTVEHNNKIYTVVELRKNSYSSNLSFKSVDFTSFDPSSYKIKKIGDDVFYGSSVDPNTLPPSVEEIGARNFMGRSNITSVTLPAQLRILGSQCFQSCSNLQSVKGKYYLQQIDHSAFAFCQKLKSVELSYSVEEIGGDAFVSCTALESVTIPSAKVIGTGTFQDCPKLTSISLPYNLESIGDSAFLYCTGLTSIVIPDNVTSIGQRAFEHCDKLEYILFKPVDEPAYVDWHGEAADFATCFDADIESKMYVPSRKTYSHGIEMISFEEKELVYTGQSPEIPWVNNTPWPVSMNTANLPKTAGEHSVTLTATFQEPNIRVTIPLTFSIAKAPLKVTVNNSEKEYGSFDQNYSCSFDGFVNGEDESNVKLNLSYLSEVAYNTPVGTYPVYATLSPSNYEPEVTAGTCTIKRAPMTVKVTDQTKTYGNPNPAFSCSYQGLKSWDSTITLTSPITYVTDASEDSNVGTYTISAIGGETDNYYFAEYIPGVLTVNKADCELSITNAEQLAKLSQDDYAYIEWECSAPHTELAIIQSPYIPAVELVKETTVINGENIILYKLHALSPSEGDVILRATGSPNHYDAFFTFHVNISKNADITDADTDNIRISTDHLTANISGKEPDEAVYVYSINGNLIYSGVSDRIEVAQPGVYIIAIKNTTYIIAL